MSKKTRAANRQLDPHSPDGCVPVRPKFDYERNRPELTGLCPEHNKVSTDFRGVNENGMIFHCLPRGCHPDEGHSFAIPLKKE